MTATPELTTIIEAILLASDAPVHRTRPKETLSAFSYGADDMAEALEMLKNRPHGAYALKDTPSGLVLELNTAYAPFVAHYFGNKPAKYPRSVIETLAIIAYRQPITRGEIENIRGVSSGSKPYQSLFERGWIRSAGYEESPGKPELLATTSAFLHHFGLRTLGDLPPLETPTDSLGFDES